MGKPIRKARRMIEGLTAQVYGLQPLLRKAAGKVAVSPASAWPRHVDAEGYAEPIAEASHRLREVRDLIWSPLERRVGRDGYGLGAELTRGRSRGSRPRRTPPSTASGTT